MDSECRIFNKGIMIVFEGPIDAKGGDKRSTGPSLKPVIQETVAKEGEKMAAVSL